MRRLMKIISLITGVMVLCMLMLSGALAQTSPITISLVTAKSVYQAGEAIKMQIEVTNTSGSVIAQEGFFTQHFYLGITFIDPDGQPVYTKYQDVGQEGGPPLRFQDKDAILVETIQAGAVKTDIMDDARTFYDITKYGHWKAQVVAFLETYSTATSDPNTGKLIAYLEDQTGSYEVKSNAATFDIVSPVPAVKSSIQVDVNLHKIGTGTKPPVEKRPLEGVSVRLYSRASLVQYEPVNWKTYSLIWNDRNITPVQVKPTNSKGIATFEQVNKNDYIVMTSYEGTNAAGNIDSADTDWGTGTLQKHLTFMQKADNSKVPGKTTVKKGTLLLITEPEYVEWDSTRELYPFVFETIGDWGVSTSVAPPEGFVADYKALSAEVTNETESVQFTITDVGSKWEETEVTYKIKHKGKTEVLRSKIGIKLSKELAKKKNKSIYGDSEGPGNFEGGKKTDKKKEE